MKEISAIVIKQEKRNGECKGWEGCKYRKNIADRGNSSTKTLRRVRLRSCELAYVCTLLGSIFHRPHRPIGIGDVDEGMLLMM